MLGCATTVSTHTLVIFYFLRKRFYFLCMYVCVILQLATEEECWKKGGEGRQGITGELLRTDAGDKIIIVKVEYSSRERSGLGATMAHQLKVKKAKSEERKQVKVIKAKSETFLKVTSLALSQGRDSMPVARRASFDIARSKVPLAFAVFEEHQGPSFHV